jgi:hypothetical protein
VAELAVQLAEFSALAAGKLGMPRNVAAKRAWERAVTDHKFSNVNPAAGQRLEAAFLASAPGKLEASAPSNQYRTRRVADTL